MFVDIDNTIKNLAKFLFYFFIVIGLGYILMSIISGDKILTLTPIVVCAGGCVSSILIYGFGVIITILDDINSKIKEDENIKVEQKTFSDEK